jgi:hypothetical protein
MCFSISMDKACAPALRQPTTPEVIADTTLAASGIAGLAYSAACMRGGGAGVFQRAIRAATFFSAASTDFSFTWP